jgi:hypothetical protein
VARRRRRGRALDLHAAIRAVGARIGVSVERDESKQ